jgi:uncharacterized protein (TIGR02646 family)
VIGVPKLDHSPLKWRVTVDRRLPRPAQFWAQGAVFEALPFADPRRVAGFYVYAPTLLAKRTRKGVTELIFPAVWNSLGVRGTLIALARKKCVYCEATPTNREKQLDHFKPKKVFPTLAYDLWNLFLACGSCNVAKLDKWPTTGGYVRPDDGDPAGRFVFADDGHVAAAAGDVDADNTVRDLELDRDEYVERRRDLAIMPRLARSAASSRWFSLRR